MFFGGSEKKINHRWNIDNFVIGSGNRSRGNRDVNDEDKFELNANIKKIEQAFSTGKSDLDAVVREIKNKRKEIRARFKTLESDPENEATFHKMDVDLIMSQVRIIESKVKFAADKFKQIRDEKKLSIDKNPKVPETQINVNQQNNPLSNQVPVTNPTLMRVATLDPSAVISGASRYDVPENASIEHKPIIDIPCTAGADGGRGAQSSVENEPVVTVRTLHGDVMETTDDVNDARKVKVLKRLANQDEAFDQMKSVQGIDFKRSIDAIVNKTKNLSKKMFIDPNSGTYYIRTFEETDGGSIPCSTEIFDSILHIGLPEFNSKNKTVKTQYEDESIPYEIIEDNTQMPSYYKDSWKDPSVRRFILSEEQLAVL